MVLRARGRAAPGAGRAADGRGASSGDGECDDGGPDSLYDICPLGSDCTDCGSRVDPEEEPEGMFADEPEGADEYGGAGDEPGCENTCSSSHDGECDDGGPGSLYDICEYGTDCADCGAR